MAYWSDYLAQAATASAAGASPFTPEHLLAAADALPNPIATLSDPDTSHVLFDALAQDLSFDWPVRAGTVPIHWHQLQCLTNAIGWLMRTLSSWTAAADPRRQTLAAILVLATRLDENGALWRILPAGVENNTLLGNHLAEGLERAQIALRTPGWTRSPIADQEQIDQFLTAETSQDWSALRYFAEQMNFHFPRDTAFDQTIRLLNRYFPGILADAMRSVTQLSMAMKVVTAVNVLDSLVIAIASSNHFVQFAAVCRLFNRFERVDKLSALEEDALVTLLTRISQDTELWHRWMGVFATNPFQTGLIQPAIGRCLAVTGDHALTSFIGAINLDSGLSREEVKACLSAFADRVPEGRRKAAWRQAFDRWAAWNFGDDQGYVLTSELTYTALDFAVVGYALECLSVAERDTFVDDCVSEVGRADIIWHSSTSAMMKYVWRAISRLQPFAHASTCAASERDRWLWTAQHYVPAMIDNPFWIKRYALFKVASSKVNGHSTDALL